MHPKDTNDLPSNSVYFQSYLPVNLRIVSNTYWISTNENLKFGREMYRGHTLSNKIHLSSFNTQSVVRLTRKSTNVDPTDSILNLRFSITPNLSILTQPGNRIEELLFL